MALSTRLRTNSLSRVALPSIHTPEALKLGTFVAQVDALVEEARAARCPAHHLDHRRRQIDRLALESRGAAAFGPGHRQQLFTVCVARISRAANLLER